VDQLLALPIITQTYIWRACRSIPQLFRSGGVYSYVRLVWCRKRRLMLSVNAGSVCTTPAHATDGITKPKAWWEYLNHWSECGRATLVRFGRSGRPQWLSSTVRPNSHHATINAPSWKD